MKKFLAVLAVLLIATAAVQAQVIFQDDFENGLGNWSIFTGGTTMDLATDKNAVPANGTCSAYANLSQDKMFHNLGTEITGVFSVSWYIYDDTMTRPYGEVRANTGTGIGDGALQALFAAGKYNQVTMPGEVYSGSKYQGRFSSGTNAGWFNLTDGPNRSAGWHKFAIERDATGAVKWYVDDILARTITTANAASIDSIAIGFGTNSTSNGNAWYDGVMVAVPEPSSLVALTSGMIGMAGFAIRRRRS